MNCKTTKQPNAAPRAGLPNIVTGIDVSKHSLEVFTIHRTEDGTLRPLKSAPVGSFEYTTDGIEKLIHQIRDHAVELAVLEPTGGYERPLLQQLRKHGINASMPHASRPRAFAAARGSLAKTDRIDARILAEFGATIPCRITPELDPDLVQLRELARERSQIVDSRTVQHGRLESATQHAMKRIRQTIRHFDRQIEAIDAEIKALLEASHKLQESVRLIKTTPGCGEVNSVCLLTELPELGTLSPRKIAAMAGLAPWTKESGEVDKKRSCSGGRRRIRSLLFMAALSITRTKTPLRDYYDAMIARGKPKKVALNALARKLLTIVNAIVRDQRPWQPDFTR